MVKLKLLAIDEKTIDRMNQIIGSPYYLAAALEISQYTGDSNDQGKTVSTASIVYLATSAAGRADPDRTRRFLEAIASTYSTSVKRSLPGVLGWTKTVVGLDETSASFYSSYLKK